MSLRQWQEIQEMSRPIKAYLSAEEYSAYRPIDPRFVQIGPRMGQNGPKRGHFTSDNVVLCQPSAGARGSLSAAWSANGCHHRSITGRLVDPQIGVKEPIHHLSDLGEDESWLSSVQAYSTIEKRIGLSKRREAAERIV